MGTLQNQKPREAKRYYDNDINNFFEEVKEKANKYKMTTSEIIEGYKVLEVRRRNDLLHANGDIHDEQMSGFGEIFQEIANALRKDD